MYDICGVLGEHIRRYFAGHGETGTVTLQAGPVTRHNPHSGALRVPPGRRDGLWRYASAGGRAATRPSAGPGIRDRLTTALER
jgi:hypothetical protein